MQVVSNRTPRSAEQRCWAAAVAASPCHQALPIRPIHLLFPSLAGSRWDWPACAVRHGGGLLQGVWRALLNTPVASARTAAPPAAACCVCRLCRAANSRARCPGCWGRSAARSARYADATQRIRCSQPCFLSGGGVSKGSTQPEPPGLLDNRRGGGNNAQSRHNAQKAARVGESTVLNLESAAMTSDELWHPWRLPTSLPSHIC